MTLTHGQLLAVKLPKDGKKFVGSHELCFCLQLMHERVQGIAWSRGAAMGSPQSRQIP